MAPSVDESLETGKPAMAAALASGVNTLDNLAEYTFVLYDRVVLPADGYVFWVRRTPAVAGVTTLTVQGSLHVATVNTQDEAANISQSRATFTSLQEVNSLIEIDSQTMWIVTLEDGLRVAFYSQGGFYEQADLYHYVGFALYADNDTQVIDNAEDLPTDLIVSNSLPIWLFLSEYVLPVPPVPGGLQNPFTLYPSFLVPDNISPAVRPYGAVHIAPESTIGLSSAQMSDANSSFFQLAKDIVTITLYGGTNSQAMQFIAFVNQYSLDYGSIGIMNVPIPQDQKRTQAEFGTLAMKKTVTFEISYAQQDVRNIARQMLTTIKETFIYP